MGEVRYLSEARDRHRMQLADRHREVRNDQWSAIAGVLLMALLTWLLSEMFQAHRAAFYLSFLTLVPLGRLVWLFWREGRLII